MAVTARYFGKVFLSAFNKEIDLDADTLKVMLCTSAYTPNQTHRYKSDITGEVTGTGYSAGGQSLGTIVPAYDNINTFSFSGDAFTEWSGATFSCRYAIIYDSSPATDATRPLIGYIDFGQDESRTAQTFRIDWNASGVAGITLS